VTETVSFWLALTRIDGLGIRGCHRLIEHFGSPQAAYMASLTELESCGVPARVAQAIFMQSRLKEAEREVEEIAKADCELVAYDSDDYPPQLKQIPDAPLVLYLRGDAKVLSEYAVSIVGSRRPSAYGSSVAHRLAYDLAGRHLTIVSGLARGIDSAAHRGALEAKGRTIAVLGSGIDVIYPRENKKLADEICKSGAVISEFPRGTGPHPENFPIRNRIISGLSLGVLVVEAAEYSGSLITARMALEQNREVFAVPGNITTAQSFGPNHLIKQGAKLVDQWMDVVEEFSPEVRSRIQPPMEVLQGELLGVESGAPFGASLAPDPKAVLETLRLDQTSFVDDVVTGAGIPHPRVLAALLELEMSGLVRQLPGKNFIRKL
jgi:DNA processing protein